MASEVLGPTSATFLNRYNSQLHASYLSRYPQISVALTPHQRRILLQPTETITEIHNFSKCCEEPTSNGYSHTRLKVFSPVSRDYAEVFRDPSVALSVRSTEFLKAEPTFWLLTQQLQQLLGGSSGGVSSLL